jgi:hypothetical protein
VNPPVLCYSNGGCELQLEIEMYSESREQSARFGAVQSPAVRWVSICLHDRVRCKRVAEVRGTDLAGALEAFLFLIRPLNLSEIGGVP